MYGSVFKRASLLSSGTVFTPADFPGLVVWLDANENITLNGGDVSAWGDRSAEVNDVAQATASIQPLFVSSWRNGKSAIDFTGGTDLLRRNTFTGGSLSQPITIFTVSEWNTAGDYIYDGVGSRVAIFRNSAIVAFFAGTGISTASQPANGAAIITRATYNGASSDLRIEPDGASVITATGNPGANAMEGLTVGNWSGGSLSSKSPISEIIIYDKVTSEAENDLLGEYLSNKYNIVHT